MRESADGYAPGFGEDALAMMSRRTAEDRVGFFLTELTPGMRVLDAGCGPGTITLGLARAVAPGGSCAALDREPSQVALARAGAARGGVEHVAFQVASIYELPFADASFDAALSHAVFEHLARPAAALAELRRVLRPGGLLGVCSSDWGDARIEPGGPDVDAAVRVHLALRRAAGGDPYAGQRLADWVEAAGFLDLRVSCEHHVDMPYRTYARYIGARIEAAALQAPPGEQDELRAAAEAATRWAHGPDGELTQPWTSVLASCPYGRRKASSPSRR